MNRPHEQLDGLSLKTITDILIEEITEEYGVSKATARNLLATALNRNLVSNEVMNMVHFLMTGWEKE